MTDREPPTLPTIFPSDLAAARSLFELELVGRLVGQNSTTIWVADAFATVTVVGTVTAPVGSLIRLHVRHHENALGLVEVLEVQVPTGSAAAEHARLITQGVGAKLRARSLAMQTIRAFFGAHAFVEVDTPLRVPSPGLDLHLDAVETAHGYLITSPEYQMKRLLAGGMPRIFQLSHVFREGELGALHNPEFTMLEWYRAFAGVESVMRDTEDLVRAVAGALAGGHHVRVGETTVSLDAPFVRLSVAQAFSRFADIGANDALTMAEDSPDDFYRTLVEQVEPALALVDKPLFLIDYPLSQASLARKKPGEPRVCERFELYVGGIELCNGFGELTDAAEQQRRLLRDQAERARVGKPVYPIDQRFLAALEEGMPASAGNALGVDRLVALCLGEPNIAAVMPFPSELL